MAIETFMDCIKMAHHSHGTMLVSVQLEERHVFMQEYLNPMLHGWWEVFDRKNYLQQFSFEYCRVALLFVCLH